MSGTASVSHAGVAGLGGVVGGRLGGVAVAFPLREGLSRFGQLRLQPLDAPRLDAGQQQGDGEESEESADHRSFTLALVVAISFSGGYVGFMENARFGRLVVTSTDGAMWSVRCDCGTEKSVRRKEVLRSARGLRSCGCLQREAVARTGRERNRTHGMKGTPTYRSWTALRNRCMNPRNPAFPNYGGRGIFVAERWSEFENFLADMGERPEGSTIDRIDNSRGYEPGNCRWASVKEQSRNRRSNNVIEHEGRAMTLVEWSAATGLSRSLIAYRLRAGWPVQEALSRAVRPRSG